VAKRDHLFISRRFVALLSCVEAKQRQTQVCLFPTGDASSPSFLAWMPKPRQNQECVSLIQQETLRCPFLRGCQTHLKTDTNPRQNRRRVALLSCVDAKPTSKPRTPLPLSNPRQNQECLFQQETLRCHPFLHGCQTHVKTENVSFSRRRFVALHFLAWCQTCQHERLFLGVYGYFRCDGHHDLTDKRAWRFPRVKGNLTPTFPKAPIFKTTCTHLQR
jgi:hypothetical protein